MHRGWTQIGCQDRHWDTDRKEEGTWDGQRRDGGTSSTLRIKEHEKRLTRNEHDDKVVYSRNAFHDKERAIILKRSSSNCDIISIAVIHNTVKSRLWNIIRFQYRNFSNLCHCCTYVCWYCWRVDAWSPRELISACSYPVIINRDRGPSAAALQHTVRVSVPDSFRVRKL
jgi:hypothetical protein